jgi:alpha-glucan,water dikinase
MGRGSGGGGACCGSCVTWAHAWPACFPTHRLRSDGLLEVDILLPGDEASDVLNFVLKDEATNSWYDCNGSNFAVKLRQSGAAGSQSDSDDGSGTVVLPKSLCDRWAWARWDNEGRSRRGESQAADEYDDCVLQMRQLLARGRTMDELWKVANGELNYAEFIGRHLPKAQAPAAAPPAPPPEQKQAAPKVDLGPIPQDLMEVQAYVLWEKNGKPAGGDFAADALRTIEQLTKEGLDYNQASAGPWVRAGWAWE